MCRVSRVPCLSVDEYNDCAACHGDRQTSLWCVENCGSKLTKRQRVEKLGIHFCNKSLVEVIKSEILLQGSFGRVRLDLYQCWCCPPKIQKTVINFTDFHKLIIIRFVCSLPWTVSISDLGCIQFHVWANLKWGCFRWAHHVNIAFALNTD